MSSKFVSLKNGAFTYFNFWPPLKTPPPNFFKINIRSWGVFSYFYTIQRALTIQSPIPTGYKPCRVLLTFTYPNLTLNISIKTCFIREIYWHFFIFMFIFSILSLVNVILCNFRDITFPYVYMKFYLLQKLSNLPKIYFSLKLNSRGSFPIFLFLT